MLFVVWCLFLAAEVNSEDRCEKLPPWREAQFRHSTENLMLTIKEENNSTDAADVELFYKTLSTPTYLRTSAWFDSTTRIMDKIIWSQFCERILVQWAINLCLGVNCPSILCRDAVSTQTSGTLIFNSVPGQATQNCGFVIANPGKRISISCNSIGTSVITYNGLTQNGYNTTGQLTVFVPVVVPDSLRIVVNDANLASPLNCSWTAFLPPTLDGR